MSDKKKAAFPNEYDSGMTLREYYAGLAMQGLCSNPALIDSDQGTHWVTDVAWKQADDMIAALQREAGDDDD